MFKNFIDNFFKTTQKKSQEERKKEIKRERERERSNKCIGISRMRKNVSMSAKKNISTNDAFIIKRND